jgi:hypothetical protein
MLFSIMRVLPKLRLFPENCDRVSKNIVSNIVLADLADMTIPGLTPCEGNQHGYC